MIHIIFFVSVVLLFLTTFVSWGKIEGNGMLCEPNPQYQTKENNDFVTSYFFENDEVREYRFSVIDKKIKVSSSDDMVKSYYSDDDDIRWDLQKEPLQNVSVSLKRDDLISTKYRISSDGTKTSVDILDRRKCEVFNKIQFQKELEKLESKYQSELDRKIQ